MTPEQKLKELRQEFAMNERLTGLLHDVAKSYADKQLRDTYGIVDHASLIRLTGVAAGVESFTKLITEMPTTAQSTGPRIR